MKPPSPVRMWAVVVHYYGGRNEIVRTDTIRRTKKGAIAAYNADSALGRGYEFGRRHGFVRVARVVVSVEVGG